MIAQLRTLLRYRPLIRSLVSRELGIPRNTLYRKLRRYGLDERPNEAES